jgi:lysine 2,3-aminomutase
LVDLFEKVADLGLQAYYLHHPDQVKGGLHFYVPLEEGRRLVSGLRQRRPGWAIPQYIYDIPGGFGKTSAFSEKMLDKDGIERQVIEPSLNLH